HAINFIEWAAFVLPDNEELRLLDLYSYEILDTAPEQEFDDLVQLASQICQCPASMITFVDADRQWFKAKIGLKETETPRSVAFCAHTILQDEPMIIENALEDERFFDSPLVTDLNIRFYAGAPIISPAGHKLGSVCVMDTKPNSLNAEQQAALTIISRQLTKLIELRGMNIMLRKRATEIIELKNNTLEEALKQQDASDKIVAYELHEQIGQKIAASNFYLNMLERDEKSRDKAIPWIRQTIQEVIADIRKLTDYLVPSTLDTTPIQVVLKDFVGRMRGVYPYKISISFSGKGNNLNLQNSIACFKVVEKWLEVLGKKENVQNVIISFAAKKEIEVEISDDGSQTDFHEMEKNLVMSTVYNRLKMANGSVTYSLKENKNVLSAIIPTAA
ncbi:MAG: GAF domain-containing protein, partial [Chitinophagaceae bacterium]